MTNNHLYLLKIIYYKNNKLFRVSCHVMSCHVMSNDIKIDFKLL